MKIYKFLSKFSLKQLTLIPVAFSIFIILILTLNENNFSQGTQDFLIVLILYSWGAVGLPIIIKKESPTIMTPIRGWLAVFQESFILLSFWIPAIYISIKMLIK